MNEKLVDGWDDPRMPTLSGARRRGYTPEAFALFAKRIGVSKAPNLIEYDILESCVREHLDVTAERAMAVIDPIKVVITNLPDGHEETIETSKHPKFADMGTRTLYFTKEIYIDSADFMENPPADFFRLGPGKEVRLRNAYVIKCNEVIKNSDGSIKELRCAYDTSTSGGKPPADGRKVKGMAHWVSVEKSVPAEVRLYERLFAVPDPENVPEGKDFKSNLNPNSLKVMKNARVEWSLKDVASDRRFQFERVGYFCTDVKNSKPGALVFNRVVELPSGR